MENDTVAIDIYITKMIGNLEYITGTNSCGTCEFTPPCRECAWVDRGVVDDEAGRKYYVKEKKKKMNKLYKKYGMVDCMGRSGYKSKKSKYSDIDVIVL